MSGGCAGNFPKRDGGRLFNTAAAAPQPAAG
jgi:hypothetical protein